ncbi:MAG: type 1 glutamine amidotransferase, partial [Bacteroidia bacterium]
VYANKQKEIGWFDVKRTGEAADWFPKEFSPFHWHGDTFDLPNGATLLASSSRCINQAFVAGEKQVGLQFHPEANEALVKAMIAHCGDELINIPGIQTAGEMLLNIEQKTENNKAVLYPLLDSVFS